MSREPVLALAVVAFASVMAIGCCGTQTRIVARSLEHPVSFTRSVATEDGRIVETKKSDRRGELDTGFRRWSILFGLVPLGSRTVDISERLEDEIDAHEGNAIVNLRAEYTFDWWWWFTALTLVLPQSIDVDLEGDVVRLESLEQNAASAKERLGQR